MTSPLGGDLSGVTRRRSPTVAACGECVVRAAAASAERLGVGRVAMVLLKGDRAVAVPEQVVRQVVERFVVAHLVVLRVGSPKALGDGDAAGQERGPGRMVAANLVVGDARVERPERGDAEARDRRLPLLRLARAGLVVP